MQGWQRQCWGGKASHPSVFQAGCLQKPQVCVIEGVRFGDTQDLLERHKIIIWWESITPLCCLFCCILVGRHSYQMSQKLEFTTDLVAVVFSLCLCHCVCPCNCFCLYLFSLTCYLYFFFFFVKVFVLVVTLIKHVKIKIHNWPGEANGGSGIWKWRHLLPLVQSPKLLHLRKPEQWNFCCCLFFLLQFFSFNVL